eukprot:gene11180-23359_t
MSGLMNGIFRTVAKQYQKVVASRLAPYGLKYDDIIVEKDDVQTALARLDSQSQLERERRIKRAFDISSKKKPLPKELQTEDTYHVRIQYMISMISCKKTVPIALPTSWHGKGTA